MQISSESFTHTKNGINVFFFKLDDSAVIYRISSADVDDISKK